MSVPVSQCTPPHLPPLRTISLFSASVSISVLSVRLFVLGWPKSSFGFFHNVLQKNLRALFGQPRTVLDSTCKQSHVIQMVSYNGSWTPGHSTRVNMMGNTYGGAPCPGLELSTLSPFLQMGKLRVSKVLRSCPGFLQW